MHSAPAGRKSRPMACPYGGSRAWVSAGDWPRTSYWVRTVTLDAELAENAEHAATTKERERCFQEIVLALRLSLRLQRSSAASASNADLPDLVAQMARLW